MKKILCLTPLLLYIVFSCMQSVFASEVSYTLEEPPVLGEAAVLMDVYTGSILYGKNMDTKQYPASITKIMTALLALEYGKLDETVVFSENAISSIEANSSNIALKPGEELTLEQCLYALLIQSANEVAVGIAEHLGTTQEGFAKMMNERAKQLGCTNTNFINPNGLHDPNHYTTARDMALIAKEVIKQDKFREIIATDKYTIAPTNKQPEARNLYIQNQMKKPPSIYVYEGCEGGKTGFTDEARNTLVTYAKRGDLELLAVTLKEEQANAYIDSAALFDYGFQNFKRTVAFEASSFKDTKPVKQIYKTETLDAGTINISAASDMLATLPNTVQTTDISLKPIYRSNTFSPPIKQGDGVGTLEASYNNIIIGSTALIAQNDVEAVSQTKIDEIEKSISQKKILDILKKVGIGLVITIVACIVFVILARTIHRRNKKRRRRNRRTSSGYIDRTPKKRKRRKR